MNLRLIGFSSTFAALRNSLEGKKSLTKALLKDRA